MTEEHGLSREQAWSLADALCRGAGMGPCFNYDPAVTGGCSRCEAQIHDDLAPTVAAMLADAEKRGEDRGRAEVVRDVRAERGGSSYQMASRIETALARHTATAAREGTTEPLRASGGSAGGSESPRAAGGRTEPQPFGEAEHLAGIAKSYADEIRDQDDDPTCGERHGDMRCQLRRGHDGACEDYSAVAQDRRA